MGRHPMAVVISHITYARTMKVDYSRFIWGGLRGKHVVTYRTHNFIRILWAPWRWRSCSAETCKSKIDILNIWFTLKMHFVGLPFIIIVLLCFWTSALGVGEGSASRPGRFLPPAKTRYPLYSRLGGPQDRSGQVRKISPPLGFDPRTVQQVTSRYTDWATRPTNVLYNMHTTRLRFSPNVFLSETHRLLVTSKARSAF
jgi:hypothetical protein